MKRTSETLGVSRSSVYKEPRMRLFYNKTGDAELLPLIERLIRERPSYGYRRICALINREGYKVNHKRIYRIMKRNGLLLPKHKLRPERSHDGRVSVDERNTRWCSDVFEIKCQSGERVRVSFILDCCDREIISYTATTGGMDSSLICDMALWGVECRFGGVYKLPREIEWLTDNGPCYISHETKKFLRELGFKVATTPICSPESNGMAESFVKTFKRDYVYLNDRPDAVTVMVALDGWFEDYNEIHPHKALKMASPREFIKKLSTTTVY